MPQNRKSGAFFFAAGKRSTILIVHKFLLQNFTSSIIFQQKSKKKGL